MPKPTTPREANIAIFRRYIELENARDYKAIEDLFHPTDYICYTWFGSHPIHPAAHTRMLKGLFRAFPDWYMTINEIITADDHSVAGRITGRGTQYEEFMGRPPSDQQIAIMLVHTIKVRGDKIVEYRSTNPFDDPFRADIVANEDIQAARAQQGLDDALFHGVTNAALHHGLPSSAVETLKAQFDIAGTRCHSLLKKNFRRCQMAAAPNSLYCAHHEKHGYGVDGVE